MHVPFPASNKQNEERRWSERTFKTLPYLLSGGDKTKWLQWCCMVPALVSQNQIFWVLFFLKLMVAMKKNKYLRWHPTAEWGTDFSAWSVHISYAVTCIAWFKIRYMGLKRRKRFPTQSSHRQGCGQKGKMSWWRKALSEAFTLSWQISLASSLPSHCYL